MYQLGGCPGKVGRGLVDIRYSNTNQWQGKADVTGELVIMNWQPSSLAACSDNRWQLAVWSDLLISLRTQI